MTFQLSHREWGEGSNPLVLLHGFTGDSSAWEAMRPFWEKRHRVLAVDLPGHGGTGLPPSTGTEGFAQTLDALAELLSRKVGGPVDLLGYSLGARVALAFALARPERIRRLVLESGSPGLPLDRERVARRREDGALAEVLEREGLEPFLKSWEALPLFSRLAGLPRDRAEAIARRRRRQSATGLAGALRCLGLGAQINLWPKLSGFDRPCLLITGGEDEKFTRLGQQMARELPLALHRVLGAGHAPHLELPQQYAEEVSAFLDAPGRDLEISPVLEESR